MKTILVDAFRTFVTEEEKEINRELFGLLETYPNNKIILTLADEQKQKELGLVNLPYPLFTTNMDPLKTDPEYYKNVLAEYNLSPDDVVYFEHNPEAVETARSLGIASHHYDKDKKDLGALKNFLDENLTN